jgi:hypothetical protein
MGAGRPDIGEHDICEPKAVNVKTKKGVIGILTGGGDVPGLNPAIRAVTIRALREGCQVIGIQTSARARTRARTKIRATQVCGSETKLGCDRVSGAALFGAASGCGVRPFWTDPLLPRLAPLLRLNWSSSLFALGVIR